MAEESKSRLSKSVTNAKVTLFFTVATFLISFFSRKYFLDGLGPEVMGMRETLYTILWMLGLSELGIGVAIGASLYKPLHDKDYNTINEIISLQGWLYRLVFTFITIGVAILMFGLPSLLSEMKAPILYAYLTVAVSYIGTMLSYTVNYKSIILNADQKGYKITKVMSTATLSKNIIQLFILKYITDPYIYWIVLDLIISLVGVFVVDRAVHKEYPWLKIDKSRGREYIKKHPSILKDTGQLFVRNITNFILSSATPWFIFTTIGLSMVAFYSNYKNLITNVRTLLAAVFTNLGPAIASIIAEGDDQKTYKFFWEAYALKQFLGSVLVLGIFLFITPFIGVWLGDEYKLGFSSLAILSLMAYLDFTRWTTDSYVIGFKLFSDVWAPIAEGALNILLAIVLGKIYGLDGVLAGTFISVLLLQGLWKPYFLFTRGFKRSAWDYFGGMIKYPTISISLALLFYWGRDTLGLNLDSYLSIALHAAWIVPTFAAILFAIYYAVSPDFRLSVIRFSHIVRPKLPEGIRRHLPQ